MIPRVKICCIATAQEAQIARVAGASAIGLVSEMPSGPGPIPEERIREIAESVHEAIEGAPYVDALLLDSGNPQLEVKELGGTGRTHDWNTSRRIHESVRIPVYLAGGLNAANAAAAIRQVNPGVP